MKVLYGTCITFGTLSTELTLWQGIQTAIGRSQRRESSRHKCSDTLRVGYLDQPWSNSRQGVWVWRDGVFMARLARPRTPPPSSIHER